MQKLLRLLPLSGMALVAAAGCHKGPDLDAALAQAKGAGMPTTVPELNKLSQVDDKDNAAPAYEKARTMLQDPALKSTVRDFSRLVTVNDSPGGHDESALQPASALFPVLDQAVAKPHCDFGYDFSEGMNTLFPQLADIKALARLYCYRARVESDDGNWRAALADVKRVDRMAAHMGEVPNMIGMLVQDAIDAMNDGTVRQIIVRFRSNAQALAAIQSTIGALSPAPNMKRALKGELVTSYVELKQLKDWKEVKTVMATMGLKEPNLPTGPVSEDQRKAMEADTIGRYASLYSQLPDDPAQWATANRAADASQKDVAGAKDEASLFSRVGMPIFDQAVTANARVVANRRMDYVAAAVYRASAGGKLPAKLPNLGVNSTDPFSGGPFKYRVDGDRFYLYSVGSAGKDNLAGAVAALPQRSNQEILLSFG